MSAFGGKADTLNFALQMCPLVTQAYIPSVAEMSQAALKSRLLTEITGPSGWSTHLDTIMYGMILRL